jgi:hypothetical protein
MDMGTTAFRRACAALFVTVLASAGTLAVTVSPAHAATSGTLLTKGTGSYYSKAGYINLSAARGVVKTYSFKAVNTGSTAQRLRVTLGASAPLSAKLYRGLTLISSGSYLTPLTAPGGSVVLSVKASVPSGTPQSSYYAGLQLSDPATNTVLDTAYAVLHVAAPAKGTRRNDLFIKTGSQPYIGGSASYQYLSSSAIKPGSTATFALRLQNDGTARAAITLDGAVPGCPQMTVTVKLGTTNITAAVRAGTWSTGVLAPGARKDLTVSVKLGLLTACAEGSTSFQATGADAPVVNYVHVPVGV